MIKEYANGAKIYTVDGKPHRDDGPAIEWPSGAGMWYTKGTLNRNNGPAVNVDGRVEWWFNGKRISSTLLKEYFEDISNPTDDELVIFKMSIGSVESSELYM